MGGILAVDLGKTACRAAFAGADPVVVAGAPGLAEAGGVQAAEAAVLAAVRALRGRADDAGEALAAAASPALGDVRVDEAVVGAAGALAAPAAARALGEALLRSLPARRVTVTSDAVLAHAGALGGAPGVVLIAGTGAVAIAIDADGALRTADGWGTWLGDEGGGAWIGASGLRAALRAHDGRGPSTTLLEAARSRFGDPAGWPALLARDGNPARTLASFAPDVAAAAGDAAAMAIISVAADALATTARAAGDGPLAMVGGVAAIEALHDDLELVPTQGDALAGALHLTAIHEPHLIRVTAGDDAPQRGGSPAGDAAGPGDDAAGRGAPPAGDDAAGRGEPGADADVLATEAVRPGLEDVDARPVAEVVALLVAAEGDAHAAVVAAVPRIADAAERIAARLERGGRLVYAGAGTAGRLGVLDAAECGPTFGTERVRAVLAGGPAAMTEAVEGAEDAFDPADLADLTAADALVGVSASGRTPYVLGALEHARAVGALTVAIVNNQHSRATGDVTIELLTGAEVLAGSTRLTAGTAQKVVLNALSTAVMIRLGKAYGARMVDVRATNAKLRRRAVRIVRDATGVDDESAAAALAAAGGNAKTAIVALLAGVDAREAAARLDRAKGRVRDALA